MSTNDPTWALLKAHQERAAEALRRARAARLGEAGMSAQDAFLAYDEALEAAEVASRTAAGLLKNNSSG